MHERLGRKIHPHAGMVVDELGHARADAGGGWRLLAAVEAGEPVLLVVQVLVSRCLA